MKKIFFALVAIFGLWSCVQEDLPPVGPTIVDSEGGYVDVTFGVSLPDMKEVTRSMTSPQITSLHLLVFNEQGMLCDKHDAIPCDENGNGYKITTDENGNEIVTDENGNKITITPDDIWGETSAHSYFKVQLARTGMPRTIHLIANSSTAFDKYPVSSETSVITSLSVSDGQEAYWQRLVFPNGITGTPVLDGDGNQLVDEEGPHFEPSDAVKSKLTAVPMIRNYSRIEVVNASSGVTALTDVEFVLVNIPDRGSVAPYNINMGQFEAMDEDTDYDDLVNDDANHQPYTGYEPAGRQLMNNTFDGSGALVDNNNTVIAFTKASTGTIADGTINRTTGPNYLYLYERNQTFDTDNQTYVIVKGKYAGTTDAKYTYYKIAIASEDENGIHSYNLLRNIQYTIVITGAVGEGFLTAEAAYGAGASNLLNYDVTTKNLTQISDGTKSLYVEYTQKVITTDKAKVTLRYKYEDTSTSSNEDKLTTDDVDITPLEGEVITGSINDGKGNTDDDGWNTLSFTAGTTPSAGSTGYSQKIKLEIAGLVREVEYILSSRYYLQLQMPDKVDSSINSPVAAKLLIQKDLHRGVFPLEFTIVAENNSLSPVNSDDTLQLSAVTNVNADGTPGGNNFGYSVTLDRLRYEAMVEALGEDDQYVTIPLNFKTNMANAAPNGIVCSAYNEFHNLANDELYTGDLDYRLTLNPANIKVDYGVGKQITATLRLPESIDNAIWTNTDGEYLDFTISYSSNTLELTGASNATIDGNTVRVTKGTYDSGIRAFALTFNTTKDVSATTIYANATGKESTFKQASAKVTNNSMGALSIELNSDMPMLPGGGKTVSTTITVPKGLGNLAMTTTGDLELTITTSEAYLDLATRAATITKTDDKTFKVVIDDYDSDSEYSFVCEFITTAGNTLGTRTITVSHPNDYLDSASVQTVTKKKGLSMKFVANNTSTTKVDQLSNSTGYYLLVELEEASDSDVSVNLIVSGINRTTLTSDGAEVSEKTYPITFTDRNTSIYVQLTATMYYAQYYYNDAKFTIKADAGSDYETVTLNMTGDRAGSQGNRTYHYNVNVQ